MYYITVQRLIKFSWKQSNNAIIFISLSMMVSCLKSLFIKKNEKWKKNLMDFGTVPTVWYFETVPTVWYFGAVPTVWYFGTVPTVWYFFVFHFSTFLFFYFNFFNFVFTFLFICVFFIFILFFIFLFLLFFSHFYICV